MKISEAELLDALASAVSGNAPEDARTAQQMADETGLPRCTVARALRLLGAQGRVVCHKVPHVYLDGRRGVIPAYTILPPMARL